MRFALVVIVVGCGSPRPPTPVDPAAMPRNVAPTVDAATFEWSLPQPNAAWAHLRAGDPMPAVPEACAGPAQTEDHNHDGTPDVRRVVETTAAGASHDRCRQDDNNFDGQFDQTTVLDAAGATLLALYDRDFNGMIDFAYFVDPGTGVTTAWLDTDADGLIDPDQP